MEPRLNDAHQGPQKRRQPPARGAGPAEAETREGAAAESGAGGGSRWKPRGEGASHPSGDEAAAAGPGASSRQPDRFIRARQEAKSHPAVNEVIEALDAELREIVVREPGDPPAGERP